MFTNQSEKTLTGKKGHIFHHKTETFRQQTIGISPYHLKWISARGVQAQGSGMVGRGLDKQAELCSLNVEFHIV